MGKSPLVAGLGLALVDRGYKVGFLDIDTGLISHSESPWASFSGSSSTVSPLRGHIINNRLGVLDQVFLEQAEELKLDIKA